MDIQVVRSRNKLLIVDRWQLVEHSCCDIFMSPTYRIQVDTKRQFDWLYNEYRRLMIEVSKFVATLEESGVEFFTGVPVSLQKSACAYVTDNCGVGHVIAANEGGSVDCR